MSFQSIPPQRLRTMAEEKLARIASLLNAQSVCEEPFRLTLKELADAIAAHARDACAYAGAAEEAEAVAATRRPRHPATR